MTCIIDRFEGDIAVVGLQVDGHVYMINMDRRLVPPEAKEGDVLAVSIDQEDTERRRERVASKLDKLFNR